MADMIMTGTDGATYSYENIQTQAYLEGEACGLDKAVSWLKEQAVTLFREGKDERAMQMRKLADQLSQALRPDMERIARKHAQAFPVIVEGASPKNTRR